MMPKPKVVLDSYSDQRVFQGHVDGVRKLNTTKGDEQFQPNSFEIRISTTGFGRFSDAYVSGGIIKKSEVTGEWRQYYWDRHTRHYGRWDHRNVPPRWLSREIERCRRFTWREQELSELDAKALRKLIRKKCWNTSSDALTRKRFRGYTVREAPELRRKILMTEYPGLVRS